MVFMVCATPLAGGDGLRWRHGARAAAGTPTGGFALEYDTGDVAAPAVTAGTDRAIASNAGLKAPQPVKGSPLSPR